MMKSIHRLRTAMAFKRALKGKRFSSASLVFHSAKPPSDLVELFEPQIGFVVSKTVGNSVTRHRITRQLRQIAAARIKHLFPGDELVVRALPSVTQRSFKELETEFDQGLAGVDRS